MKPRLFPTPWLLCCAALLLFAGGARAQWQTQNITLLPGWNGVFLHVDASHVSLTELVDATPIEEVWLWRPDASTLQFVTSPQEPVNGGSQWLVWKRGLPAETTLDALVGNAAYLIRTQNPLPGSAPQYIWSVKGMPVPPRTVWTTSGVNFLGYSSPETGAPDLDTFLSAGSGLLLDLEHFHYVGGALTDNPKKIFSLRGVTIKRGKAFWVRSKSGAFNRHFGAFETSLQNQSGLLFRDSLGQYRVRLRNLLNVPVTVTGRMLTSETPPLGQAPVVGVPPLLLRGEIDTTTLTHGFTEFDGPATWTLQPRDQLGSEVEIIFGIDRSHMAGAAGDLFAGILRLTDGQGFSQVDLPVSATVASTQGLWIGEAVVTEVRHNLSLFVRDENGNLVQDEDGRYIKASTDDTFGPTPRPFPLRLLIHNNEDSQAVLLQHVFQGFNASTNLVLTKFQSVLDPRFYSTARRISVANLPWSKDNTSWTFTGVLGLGNTLTATVETPYDAQASNPFLHTYHPDHDNLNASFRQKLPQGVESYGIVRQIQLEVTDPEDDFSSRTVGSQQLTGGYEETVTLQGAGAETREYRVRGSFTLNRVSEIATLTAP